MTADSAGAPARARLGLGVRGAVPGTTEKSESWRALTLQAILPSWERGEVRCACIEPSARADRDAGPRNQDRGSGHGCPTVATRFSRRSERFLRAQAVSEQEEKTRVTQVVQAPPPESGANDCLVAIYTAEPGLLGKRFLLDRSPLQIGRGADSHIVLEGDSVSRRHAHLEKREASWTIVDDGSTNGTYLNDRQVRGQGVLNHGDQLKIGPTIFKFLCGHDAESGYHDEIYRMTIMDGLTQIHNKRYLFETLDKELIRARRYERELSVLMFDIDFFKRINDQFGHLAGDHVLRELARVVQERIRRDEVFARYGGEEFVIILPETALEGAGALAEDLRQRVAAQVFVFQGEQIPVTISVGCAQLSAEDRAAADVIQRADEKLYEAKRGGRNRVCS